MSLSRIAGALAFAAVAAAVALEAAHGVRDYFVFPRFHAMCYMLAAAVLWQRGGATVRGLAALTWVSAVAVYAYLHLGLERPWIAGLAWIGAVSGASAGLALAIGGTSPRTRLVARAVACAAAVMAACHVALVLGPSALAPWARPLRLWSADLAVAGGLALLPLATLGRGRASPGAIALALAGIAALPVAVRIGDVTDLYVLGVSAATLMVLRGPAPRLAAGAWVAAAAGAALSSWGLAERAILLHVVMFHATVALLWPALLLGLVAPARMDPVLRVAAVAVPALYAVAAVMTIVLWPPQADPAPVLWCRYGSISLLELVAMAALPAVLLAQPGVPRRPPEGGADSIMITAGRSRQLDRQAIAAAADPQDPGAQRDP